MRLPLRFLLPAAACVLLCACGDGDDLVVSGRIEFTDVHVGSKSGGRVAEVFVEEGDRVASGTMLVRFEAEEIEARRDAASAAVEEAQAALELLLAGARVEDLERAGEAVRAAEAQARLMRKGFRDEDVRRAEAQLAQTENSLELAREEYERAKRLYASETIGEQERDRFRTQYENARSQVEIARQTLAETSGGYRPEEVEAAEANLAEARAELRKLQNGPRPQEIARQRAALAAAQARLRELDELVRETRVQAPADVRVDVLELEPGDLVAAGRPVATLLAPQEAYVRCYVPEARMGWAQPGRRVFVTVDSYPGERFAAEIRRMRSQAEFTPRNVQTTEKRSDLVFETKVDMLEGAGRVRAGMYADVHIPPPDVAPDP